MQRVCRINELSFAELVRIRHQLRRRLAIGPQGNIIELAFGIAEKEGQLDRSRSDAICFYVRQKSSRYAEIAPIPASLAFRLKRGRGFVEVCLSTDVIDVGRRLPKPTGKPLVYLPSGSKATAGGIVAWKLPGEHRLTWGIVTVGHCFAGSVRLPDTKARVRIGHASGDSAAGVLRVRSIPSRFAQVDIALVEVRREDLVDAGWLAVAPKTSGLRIRPIGVMSRDVGRVGFTYPLHSRIEIEVIRFLPISELVPALGPLRYVVEVMGPSSTFAEGRSGSLWAFGQQVAAMQHGGLPQAFQYGWGQALEFGLEWCASQLARQHQVSVHEVDLRLIRVI